MSFIPRGLGIVETFSSSPQIGCILTESNQMCLKLLKYRGNISMEQARRLKHAIQIMLIQWESEYWTCLVYKWFKPVLWSNDHVFKCFLVVYRGSFHAFYVVFFPLDYFHYL